MLETTLHAVFITGLLGGVHCAGMCGGIVNALGFRAHTSSVFFVPFIKDIPVNAGNSVPSVHSALPLTKFYTLLLFNVGRISTYTTLGAVAGSIGSIGWWMQIAWPIQQGSFLLTNVMLIIMGLYLSGVKRIGLAMESLGRKLWSFLRPLAAQKLTQNSALNTVFAGALWGMVPCGMVYAVLITALVSGSSSNGALLMLAFGLGTLPNLLLLGSAGQWLAKASKHSGIRKVVGAIIVSFGVLGLTRLEIAARIPLIEQLCSHFL